MLQITGAPEAVKRAGHVRPLSLAEILQGVPPAAPDGCIRLAAVEPHPPAPASIAPNPNDRPGSPSKFRSASEGYYVLRCPRCKVTGAAEFWGASGLLARRQTWALNLSHEFVRLPGPIAGVQLFYGRPLVCRACGVDAEIAAVNYDKFFASDPPAMRPVAGSNFEPPVLNAASVEPANGASLPELPAQTRRVK